MTRPAGTVPVRISVHRAEQLAAFIMTMDLPEPSILGTAGMTVAEIEADRHRQIDALRELAAALSSSPLKRGRPRSAVSLFFLPREGAETFRSIASPFALPARLRPVAKRVVAPLKRRRGRPLMLTGNALARRVARYDTGAHIWADERHVRRIKRRFRMEQKLAAVDERSPAPLPASPTIKAMLAGMLRF